MTEHSFIQDLGRRWAAIRPGWPILLIPFMTSVLVTLTGQGQEVLYAMSLRPGWPLAAFILCGLLLHVRFVDAINEHYPFSANAIHSVNPIPWSALFAATSMPLVFGLSYYLWRAIDLWNTRDFGYLLFGFFECSFAILVLVTWHFGAAAWLISVFQTHLSRFLLWHRAVRLGERVLVVAVFLAAFAIWALPPWASAAGPVTVFVLAMTIWAVIANLVVVAVARRVWLPAPLLAGAALVASLVFLAWLFGGIRYPVDEVACDPGFPCAPVPAKQAAEAWLQAHASENPVNAIVVIADGGGIRQALESALVLSKLDEATRGNFFNHVYAFSGVSGGAIGIATYLAARAHHGANWSTRSAQVAYTMKSDHFSPLLAGLLLHDIPFMFAPAFHINWLPNRGELFEESLSEGWAGGPDLALPFSEAIAKASTGEPSPVVLLNTTLANLGKIATVSNVTFPDAQVPLCNVLDQLKPGRTLSLVTAAHLSARFPITNPPAEISVTRKGGQNDPCAFDPGTRLAFVDGAYADNTGAGAALNAVDALRAAASHPGAPRVQVIVLHIYATSTNPESREEVRRAGDSDRALDDFLIPVRAEGSVQYELGLAPLKLLCADMVEVNANLPTGTPGGIEKCNNIGPNQTWSLGGGRTLITQLWDPKQNLMWVNAALHVSQSAARGDYVPLGWMLGPSQGYVSTESDEIAKDAAHIIGPLISTPHSG